MKHYISEDQNILIQFNPETGVYKQRNHSSKELKHFTEKEFKSLNPKQIKRQEFSRLMNIHFKNVKHSWKYDHSHFRKLPNFESSDYNLIINYNLKDIPKHRIEGKEYLGELLLVYHWGKVYYFTLSYNGYAQGQLICPTTHQLVRWARARHCAPIFNEGTKKIM